VGSEPSRQEAVTPIVAAGELGHPAGGFVLCRV